MCQQIKDTVNQLETLYKNNDTLSGQRLLELIDFLDELNIKLRSEWKKGFDIGYRQAIDDYKPSMKSHVISAELRENMCKIVEK